MSSRGEKETDEGWRKKRELRRYELPDLGNHSDPPPGAHPFSALPLRGSFICFLRLVLATLLGKPQIPNSRWVNGEKRRETDRVAVKKVA